MGFAAFAGRKCLRLLARPQVEVNREGGSRVFQQSILGGCDSERDRLRKNLARHSYTRCAGPPELHPNFYKLPYCAPEISMNSSWAVQIGLLSQTF